MIDEVVELVTIPEAEVVNELSPEVADTVPSLLATI